MGKLSVTQVLSEINSQGKSDEVIRAVIESCLGNDVVKDLYRMFGHILPENTDWNNLIL